MILKLNWCITIPFSKLIVGCIFICMLGLVSTTLFAQEADIPSSAEPPESSLGQPATIEDESAPDEEEPVESTEADPTEQDEPSISGSSTMESENSEESETAPLDDSNESTSDTDLFSSSPLIISAQRIQRIFYDIPLSVSVITKETLAKYSQTTLPEYLTALPGISIQKTTVGQGTAYIRGVTGREVIYLLDGFRFSPAFSRSGPIQYLGLPDPFYVESIEVLRGPVSLLYGSDALGGAVNVSTPALRFSEKPEIGGRGLVQFGSGTGEKSVHFSLTGGGARIAASVYGTFRDFDYWRMSRQVNPQLFFPLNDHQPHVIEEAAYQYLSTGGKLGFSFKEKGTLLLSAMYSIIPFAYRLDSMILGYSPAPDNQGIDPLDPAYKKFTPSRAERSNTAPLSLLQAVGEYVLERENPALKKFRLIAGYQQLAEFRQNRNFAESPDYLQNDFSMTWNEYATKEENTDHRVGFISEFNSLVGIKQVVMDMVYGVDVYYDIIHSERSNINDNGTIRDHLAPRYPDYSNYLQSGLFFQDEITWTDWFATVIGIRGSLHHIYVPFNLTDHGIPAIKQMFGDVSGAIGLAFTIVDELKIISNLSKGFRAPNINDLGQQGGRFTTSFKTPNTDLGSETIYSVDAGIKWDSKRFKGELVGYFAYKNNAIATVDTGHIVDDQGTIIPTATQADVDGVTYFNEVQDQNMLSAMLAGVELGASFKVASWMLGSLTFNYCYGDQQTLDDETIPYDKVPAPQGQFHLTFIPITNWYIEPYMVFTLQQHPDRISAKNKSDSRINPDGEPAYAIFGIRSGYTLNEQFRLSLIIDNILDRDYRPYLSTLNGLGFNITIKGEYQF